MDSILDDGVHVRLSGWGKKNALVGGYGRSES
jgi:hypothetical protein